MSLILNEESLKALDHDLLNYKGKVSLIYVDPPFFTNKTQKLGKHSYEDRFESLHDYIYNFLHPRLSIAKDYLTENGSLFVHVDWRTVHYVKKLLDEIFDNLYADDDIKFCKNFMNEIIWSYDYGGRSKSYWSRKHDNILWYVKNPKDYIFNFDDIDRIPYMAPGLVGPEKAAKGKTLTDSWWNTIVPTNSKERVGYPTQKPLRIIERIVKVHSKPGDIVMDFFAGSGTTAVAAAKNDRKYIVVDENPEAIQVIRERISALRAT
jgi:site-specific DNA-methyltransferase (adenine-specific)